VDVFIAVAGQRAGLRAAQVFWGCDVRDRARHTGSRARSAQTSVHRQPRRCDRSCRIRHATRGHSNSRTSGAHRRFP
jgi:hypothetical protein